MIFGAPLALALGVPFVPLRKPGKLPGEAVGDELHGWPDADGTVLGALREAGLSSLAVALSLTFALMPSHFTVISPPRKSKFQI